MTAVRAMTPEERQRGRRAALKLAADELERLVAEVPERPESFSTGDDYEAWRGHWNDWRARWERIAEHLRQAHGAKISERHDGARITLRGVTASATSGLPTLFPAWVRKARAEVERLA